MKFKNDSVVFEAPGKVKPLEGFQFNAVMRNVFAWMTLGMGISATVASALQGSPIYPDLAVLVAIIIAHLVIAFTLARKLRRFSPTIAGAFFIFYAALTGFTLSTFFSMLFYPTVSSALVTACTSTGCLFALMTLICWRSRLDLSRGRSYVLMALLGLLITYLANRLLAGAPFDAIFSFFSVLLFSALAAFHREPVAAIAAEPDLRIKPADSLRFSLLGALQLYVTAGNMFVIALFSNLPGSHGLYYDRRMPHHQQSHDSRFVDGGGD
ncbi:MAG: Bax inhibitor-1 family protein [Chloroflexota bacterium]|nr:Bax inhibitor-1 family protein [Chloroflexota bacterium]MDE2908237.1 Bax inhibitor-1 family protein [Chloroflexota bacterium]